MIKIGLSYYRDTGCTIKSKLTHKFDIKDFGVLTNFLGIQVSTNDYGSIFVRQDKYAKELVTRFNLDNCRSVKLPAQKTEII